MIIDGRSLDESKIVVFNPDALVDTDDQIQPNGIDLRANKIYHATGKVTIPRESKAKADLTVNEIPLKDGVWNLHPDHGVYWVDFLEKVNVPAEKCGILITRSSLVRSGVDVMAGLYDTGFNGQLGGSLRVWNPVTIEWGAKLAQILFHTSKFRGSYYAGSYQGTDSPTAITS